jgi:hypothetical protein
MNRSNSRIEDASKFFDKKVQIRILLEEFEKKIFEASELLDSAKVLSQEMEEIADRRKAYYFLHRSRRLKLQIEELQESKGYSKKEFDFVYKLIEKIDENESSDFLDTLLKGSIDRVAQVLKPNEQEEFSQWSKARGKRSFLTFVFRDVHFITPKYPIKIVKNVDPQKKTVRIGSSRYEIHPGPFFGLEKENLDFRDPVHLGILKIPVDLASKLKSQNESHLNQKSEPEPIPKNPEYLYRCFFFERLEKEIKFDEGVFRHRLQPVGGISMGKIKSYFRYSGRNFYFLDIDPIHE